MLRCKKQFQRELSHRLEEYQCLASKNSDMRELDDEEYMKSLRAAYEESSSDEDELAKRALDRKKDSLNCTGHSRVAKQAEHYHRAGDDASKKSGGGHQAEGQDDYEEERYRARVALPKQAKREAIPHSYSTEGGQFTNSRLQAAQKQKAFVQQGSLDTSEEDDPEQPRRSGIKAGRPKRRPSGLANLDDMTEDQLALIKKMVESRLEDKAQAPKLSSRSKRRPEEPEVRLDDDFYDDKFLSLVYEMESQKDDSYINY